jgi:hypothetical protein
LREAAAEMRRCSEEMLCRLCVGTLLSISIPCFFGYCPCFLGVLQSRLMEAISTLKVGDTAPEFSLAAANGDQVVSLNAVLRSGPAIVEFLRGTW